MVDAVAAALIGIRGAKSQAKVSMKAELSRVEITGPPRAGGGGRGLPRPTCAAPGKITGDLVFTPDESAQQISVAADVADRRPSLGRAVPEPRSVAGTVGGSAGPTVVPGGSAAASPRRRLPAARGLVAAAALVA